VSVFKAVTLSLRTIDVLLWILVEGSANQTCGAFRIEVASNPGERGEITSRCVSPQLLSLFSSKHLVPAELA
jgi:hypothetical protein